MRILYTQTQISVEIVTAPFKSGGDGSLHEVYTVDYRHCVAKLFFAQRLRGGDGKEREKKLRYQLQNPPQEEADKTDIIWVEEILYEKGKFVGYLMRRAEGEHLGILCLPKIARRHYADYGRFDLMKPTALSLRLAACYNIAVAVAAVHKSGQYIIYDLKPENIMIAPDGRVSIIDTDNIQISEGDKLLFAAKSTTPDYTPPECYRAGNSRIVQPSWDNFSLAVVFYKFFCGLPPFSGTPKDERITSIADMVRYGLFPKGKNAHRFQTIPKLHANFDRLPENLQRLFLRAFDEGHTRPEARPSALEWRSALAAALPAAAAMAASAATTVAPKKKNEKDKPTESLSAQINKRLDREFMPLAVLMFLAVFAFFAWALYSIHKAQEKASETPPKFEPFYPKEKR